MAEIVEPPTLQYRVISGIGGGLLDETICDTLEEVVTVFSDDSQEVRDHIQENLEGAVPGAFVYVYGGRDNCDLHHVIFAHEA